MSLVTVVIVGKADNEWARLGSDAMDGDGAAEGPGRRVGCMLSEDLDSGGREEVEEEEAKEQDARAAISSVWGCFDGEQWL